jgi:hypothetical protein
MFGPGAVIALIFPGIGLAMVVFSLRWGLARDRLLAQGKTAAATFKSKAPTNVTVNRQPLMAVTFDFVGDDGRRHEVIERTTSLANLTDEAKETVLYLPADPSKATMVDKLSPSIEADEGGNLKLAHGSRVWLALLLPILTTLSNGACAVSRFGR